MSKQVLERKIKVLHVVGSMTAGGLETLIMNLYRNMDRSKVQFDFAVQTNEKCFYDDEIIQKGGKIIPHPKPSDNLIKYKMALKETIKKYGPYDVIHSHVLFFSGVVIDIANKENIPIRIAHSHTSNNSKYNSLLRKMYKRIMRKKIINNATHLIGCSSEACEFLFGNNSLEAGITRHFPNAIDPKRFKTLKKDSNYLTNELKLPDDSLIIGHIGRFTKAKNHVLLIEVFTEYLKRNANAHLILVGDGEERKCIEQLVYENMIEENVHFLGLREDIEKILSAIDLFLFPSLYEGLGIALIEAQAAGVPCLISDTIPVEADLNIGLAQRRNLSDKNDEWVQAIDEVKKIESPSWDNRESALKDTGYDINISSKKLLKIYSGEE
ncbi:glycosyltransferase family 1 protein [Oceanobacillus manasiensis]|uniref:glycosyltransferase family 1 protein n=1 Tax=Oceanobacillus manasiensis TaxID=586413 RepID=UPI000693239E|nr:glycosyltransferase family 1 protein [Oceanobacillus manasiensis]